MKHTDHKAPCHSAAEKYSDVYSLEIEEKQKEKGVFNSIL
jgi:hypothetical protein